MALACAKGRGSTSLTNRTCQQLCALALTSDSTFHVRWIPPERNCADQPSRSPWLKSRLTARKRSFSAEDPQADGFSARPGATTQEGTTSVSNCRPDRDDSSRCPVPLGGEQSAEGGDARPRPLHHNRGGLPVLVHVPLQPVPRLRRAPHGVPQRVVRSGCRRIRRGVRFRRLSVYRFPDYGKLGSKTLARAYQAFEGYRNLAPPKMRFPTSGVGFAAIVGAMLARSKMFMALGLLLQWDLLLLPSSLR